MLSVDVFLDFQALLPGFGGGLGLGVTANGQLFVEFTAQAEFGVAFNANIGLQGNLGRRNGDFELFSPETESFGGAQVAVGVVGVLSGGVSTTDGKSFGVSGSGGKLGKVGLGIAAQEALIVGTNTKVAFTPSIPQMLCGE